MNTPLRPGVLAALAGCLAWSFHESAAQLASPPAAKDNKILVVKIVAHPAIVVGGVEKRLKVDDEIPVGAQLRIPVNGSVVLVAADGTAMQLGSDSELEVLSRGSATARPRVALNRGEILADVNTPAAAAVESFQVQTPVAKLQSEDGVFRAVFRPVPSGQAFMLQAACLTGKIEVTKSGGTNPAVVIPPGQEFAIAVNVATNFTGQLVAPANMSPAPLSPATLLQLAQLAAGLAYTKHVAIFGAPSGASRPVSAVNATFVPPPVLSSATLDKIQRMRPLFDGRTLDAWIQTPAPLNFAREDVIDFSALVNRLNAKSDAVSAFLAAQLDEAGAAWLEEYVPNSVKLRDAPVALLRNLNRIVTSGSPIYDEQHFQGVILRPATEALRRKNPRGSDLARLNRLLLEDAFPEIIARRAAVGWIVKNGAMASTGAGRGVIYTEQDFRRYRLIFTMRHVSGYPDHQPCVLVFGTRPAPGERGLDALGGIQFQTPNGGHWDYRPGRNHAGTAFTRPVRTSFDNRQWHQVEILVDASTGTARMAVAQPVGTRAIENCVFKDPAAGKPGPIAWQMHNAGLFDEFKDVRIEIDPREDRLITVD